jgi:hypothetical protein
MVTDKTFKSGKGKVQIVDDEGNPQRPVDKDLDDITTYEKSPSDGTSGRKATAEAGTRVQLVANPTPCIGVFFQAFRINTNLVTVGFDDVVGTPENSIAGFESLESGDTTFIPIDDASKLYLDSMVSGEGVKYTILTRS